MSQLLVVEGSTITAWLSTNYQLLYNRTYVENKRFKCLVYTICVLETQQQIRLVD